MNKIIVAGLLPVQNQELARRYGKLFDIRFITTDSTAAAWEKVGRSDFERVFLATKFISHCHQEAFPRDKVVFVNGALSAMCRELDKHVPISRRETLPPLLPPEEDMPREVGTPTFNIMRDFAHRNGLLSDSELIVEPGQTPIAHQVYDLLLRRAVDSDITPKKAVELLGLPHDTMDAVNMALFKAHKRGYMDRPSRGVYKIIEKTAQVAALKGRATKPRSPMGRRATHDPVQHLETIATELLQLIETLKKAPKFDITTVPNKALYAEVARRNTK